MEILRMAPNRFTLILLGMLVLFAVMVKPAHARNEYLNNNSQACQYGSFDVQTSYGQQDTEYNHYSPNNNYDNYGRNKEIRFTDANESIKGDGSNLILKSGGTAFTIKV